MFTLSSIQQYAKSGIREITKHKLLLLLNILGLAVGIATIILMAAYSIHEFSYDKEHPNADRTYRVMELAVDSGRHYSMTSPHAFQHYQAISGVEDYVGLIKGDWFIETKVQINGGYLQLQNVYAATEHVLDFFNIQVAAGSIKKALNESDKIALSESEAIRFFGKTDVVDQVLVTAKQTWIVVGVFKDLPANTHLKINALIASKPFEGSMGKVAYAYVRLSPSADVNQISNATTQIMTDIWKTTNTNFYLQPLLDIHLGPNLKEAMKAGGSHLVATLSSILCVLLLFMISFCSVNMSLARKSRRETEASTQQSISASVALYLVSGIFACVIADLCLCEFNLLVSRTLEIHLIDVVAILIFCILLGLFLGLYLRFYLSKAKSVSVVCMMGLVLQLAICTGLVIASFSLYQQLGFLKNLSTHYERTNRLQIVDIPAGKLFFHETFVFGGHYEIKPLELELIVKASNSSLIKEVKNIEGVISAIPTDFDLTRQLNAGVRRFTFQGMEAFPQVFGYGGVGINAANVLGLDLIAGRDFNKETDLFKSQDNSLSILIPESMLSLAGFANAEAAIGKTAQFAAGPFENINATIVGVFKDIKLGSIKENGSPMIFGCGLSWAQSANLVFQVEKDSKKVRAELTTLLSHRLQLSHPAIESLEQNYGLIYQQDHNQARLIYSLTCILLALSTISLFGLSVFTVNPKSKEVAERRALGSSRLSILWLLAKESLLITVSGLVLVSPIAFWLIEKWLANFNERAGQTMVVYIAAGLMVVIIPTVINSFAVSRVMKAKPGVVL